TKILTKVPSIEPGDQPVRVSTRWGKSNPLPFTIVRGGSIMTFQVYPDPPNNPLVVAASATSAPVPIAELIGTGPGGRTIFIRFVVAGKSGVLDPTVFLVTGDGTDEITSKEGVAVTPVAGGKAHATVYSEPPSVFRVEIFYKPTTTKIDWKIQFRNN